MKNVTIILLLGILSCFIFYTFLFDKKEIKSNPKIKIVTIDSSYEVVVHDTIINHEPTIIHDTVVGEIPKDYIPKKNYDSLYNQYIDLVYKFLRYRQYKDTFSKDSLWVAVSSIVTENELDSQSVIFGGKIKVKTINTEIKELERRFKFFAGVGIGYSFYNKIDSSNSVNFNGRIAFKNRKDNILQLGYSRSTTNLSTVEINYLRKIGFRNER